MAQPILSKRKLTGALIAAGLVLVGLVLFFFDPVRNSFYPACQFHKLTGLHCPGCGGLRALHQLTHGNIVAAFRCNPLLVVLLPFFTLVLVRWVLRGRTMFDSNTAFFRPAALWTLLALTAVFTILRNLPWPAFAWMSP